MTMTNPLRDGRHYDALKTQNNFKQLTNLLVGFK